MGTRSTIIDSLVHGATWYPEREALVQGERDERRAYTYGELEEESRRFAYGLRELGIEPGDRIVFLNRSVVEHAVAYFGALRAGAIPATIHFRESPATIQAMTESVSPTALVFQPQLRETAEVVLEGSSTIAESIVLDQLGEAPTFAKRYTDLLETPARDLPEIAPSDRAFINFSSGTTGVPKPVVHTHENIVESTHLAFYKKQIGPSDRTLKTNTPSFIAWANTTFPHVNAGATVVYLQQSDPVEILEAIDAEEITSLILVPTIWKRILSQDLEQYDLESVETAGYSGEPLDPGLFARIKERITPNICTMYGTTETMSSSMTLFPEDVDEDTLDSVGYPVPDTEVRVIEPGSRDPSAAVDRGETGEIIIRGPSVAEEIWNDPERTRATFHEDGWLFTGDLGYVGEDRLLYLRGRHDNMIISGGINIYPEKVNEVLGSWEAAADSAVIGVPHETWGETVTAIVVPRDESLTEEDVKSFCAESPDLADYQQPRLVRFVDELPKTGTSKIDYAALRERFSE
ncbi:class I adenylate-forming enzyme family protein [Natrarchaeobius oligotrophus]|uniref:Long-chain fatty acid--CoA ligase n=1 Tax=Natrarchaeobius chitinivorans TaxID=1679083 RepID=A0A3N6N0N5_NATCH|nr:class I adenylate-forming enzyme family protein [Natrarchaeobius chitinivorans]RQH02392.1 long-chain fatty acid--CoA ligase [Natrarchaeobius chitinivorans]